MDVLEMQRMLRETGHYQTPEEARRWKMPVWVATPEFALKMAKIFIIGNIHAHRPSFESKEWASFGFRVLRLVERLGGDVELSGFENIKDTKFPVVWTSNHMSSLETYLLPSVLTAFSGLQVVLKESLAHYPVFGQVVRSVRPIRLMRRNPMEDLRKVLTEGVEGVQGGRSPLIFPQGARWAHFDPKTFNSLGVKLAQRAKVPLVPLAVKMDFMGMSRISRDIGPIRPRRAVKIACGKPIPPDMNPRDMLAQSIDFVVSTMRRWEEETGDRLLALPEPDKGTPFASPAATEHPTGK